MKINFVISILVLFLLPRMECLSQAVLKPDTMKIPTRFKMLAQVEGDLDHDGTLEKVVVYDTDKDMGTERQLCVYKKEVDKWVLWKKSATVVLPSKHGGMRGDPFEGISIEKNCIVINHFGGSTSKWHYTHRYQFQDQDFRLIRASVNQNAACDYLMTFDFNLSTGNITYENETINCETDESQIYFEDMIQKVEALPVMKGFYPGNNKVRFPNSDIVIYY